MNANLREVIALFLRRGITAFGGLVLGGALVGLVSLLLTR